MLVDYPCPVDVLWIPKGKRNPRPFAWTDTVPVESLDRDTPEEDLEALTCPRP